MKGLFQQPRTFHWDSCISLSFSAKFYRIRFPHLLRLGNKIQQTFIVRIKLLIISYNSQRLYRFESVNHLLYASILFPKDFDWKLIRENELTYTSEWSFNSIITLIIIKHFYAETNIYKQNFSRTSRIFMACILYFIYSTTHHRNHWARRRQRSCNLHLWGSDSRSGL